MDDKSAKEEIGAPSTVAHAPIGGGKLVVITGVTASGKTGAALTLARSLGGELVGADSVQVYRGFDIGSAKPTAAELGNTPHHLLDILDPNEELDAAAFATAADEAIESIRSRAKIPILVGGTGLWLRAVLRGLVSLPPVDQSLRDELQRELSRDGREVLHGRLQQVDPDAAARIHANDTLRVLRALEVQRQTGRALSDFHREHQRGGCRYDARIYFLDLDREQLYPRIEKRLDTMLASGWLEETAALLERFGPDVRPMQSVGYRQMAQHLLNPEAESLPEARRKAYKASCVYTRRQRTFFRGDPSGGQVSDAQTLVSPVEMNAVAQWWQAPPPSARPIDNLQ